MAVYKELLEKFGNGKRQVPIRINPADAYNLNSVFKNHREFVEHLFKTQGLEVIRHQHEYASDGSVITPGLIYARTDSDIDPYMEVWGIVGVSVRERAT